MTESVLARFLASPGPVAYLGNSVTAQRDGYREALHASIVRAAGKPLVAINAGFGGVGTIGSLCTMDEWVVAHRPRLCFIECLTGDIGVGEHALTGAAVEAMLAKLAAIQATPVLLLLPRNRVEEERGRKLTALWRRVAAHHGAPLIDLLDLTPGLSRLTRDGVHTTANGARAYADAIFDGLREAAVADADHPEALFSPDMRSASLEPVRPYLERRSPAGLFARRLPYWTIAAGEGFTIELADTAVLGLLLIQGPHSGTIAVEGAPHVLHDRWCHYERLHAHVFPEPVMPGRRVRIASAEGELRLAAFLSFRPPS